ncbi:type II secretion system protein [Pseudocolwellia agarivorans]|uniref:type II secretion system protein n=1 Tax=Pseudocolwellia agarivorans TaxID=1911682 RepID=UPI00158B6748|nr:prepilin-type N-terminal cleavage/methylation domain-containing protein [Pseudocolwellia agarivorans]
MKSNKGYTLIEVLVAMVIFSVLITLAVSSYRYFFTSVGDKKNQSYALSLLTQRKIINTSIKGLEAYYYLDYDNKSVLFFNGKKESFSFVSYQPSYLDEPLVVSTFFIAESGKELRYCERPLGSLALINYMFRDSDCPVSHLYFEGESISFSYFGWKDAFELDNFYSEYLNVAIKPQPKWRFQYNSAETLTLPLFIRIQHATSNSLLPNEFMFELPQELPEAKREKNAFSG